MPGAFTLVDPAEDPTLVEPVLALVAGGVPPALKEWAESILSELREALTAQPTTGRAIVDRHDRPAGVVTWAALKDVTRGFRAHVSLPHPAFDGATLRGILASLAPAGPKLEQVARVSLAPPQGLPAAGWVAELGPVGFRPRSRVDCTFDLHDVSRLPSAPVDRKPRSLSLADEERISGLMLRAYARSPAERALFEQLSDPVADARLGAQDLLHGEIGTWRPDASFAIDDGPELAAATLVQDHHGLLLSEVMVDPRHRRRGYAAAVIAASVRALSEDGSEGPLRLVVSRENERAFRLYEKLGF
ncbi:MAG: GNAT family N-acetyltransferase [Thermoplasmata archaeon]|nr:GNAT family N-acetyltransferase [Thermoplasmata archaeon]